MVMILRMNGNRIFLELILSTNWIQFSRFSHWSGNKTSKALRIHSICVRVAIQSSNHRFTPKTSPIQSAMMSSDNEYRFQCENYQDANLARDKPLNDNDRGDLLFEYW